MSWGEAFERGEAGLCSARRSWAARSKDSWGNNWQASYSRTDGCVRPGLRWKIANTPRRSFQNARERMAC